MEDGIFDGKITTLHLDGQKLNNNSSTADHHARFRVQAVKSRRSLSWQLLIGQLVHHEEDAKDSRPDVK